MKLKKCKICGTGFIRNGTQIVCSALCGLKYSQKQKEKAWRKKKTQLKDTLKTHSDWVKELQIEINGIVRLIDKGSVCISSLKPLNDKYDAGHRFSTGAFPSLRFHLFNIHAQSVWQNQYNSGNPDGYDHGLECIYGLDYLNEVHDLKKRFKTLKLTTPELTTAKAKAKKIRKGLNDLNLIYTPKQRIELRKKINKELGLYI